MPKGCILSATECKGQRPPFGPPQNGPIPDAGDWHYPAEEQAEAASLVPPTLVNISGQTATFLDPATGHTESVAVGESAFNWDLLYINSPSLSFGAVVEHRFENWSATAFLAVAGKEDARVLRSPVGQLQRLQQPKYDHLEQADPEWQCKADVDPSDWPRHLAQNLSGGEATFSTAASVVPPVPDAAMFGNPEVRWLLAL